jgi:VanZ family protein
MSNPTHDSHSPSASPGIPEPGISHHAVLLGYLVIMVLLFLLPVPHRFDALARRFDGVAHFLIFLVFSLLYQLDRGPKAIRTVSITALLAGGTELVQWALPYRGGQWSDFVRGVTGAGVGVALTVLAARWPTGGHGEPTPSGPPGSEGG